MEEQPARILLNPYLAQEPDFRTAPDNTVFLALTTHGVTDEAAYNTLHDAWIEQNTRARTAWDDQETADAALAEQSRADAAAIEEAEALTQKEEREQQRQENLKKLKKLPTISPAKAMPRHLRQLPAAYALERINKRQFVSLHYFTKAGMRDAITQRNPDQEEDNVLGFNSTDGQLTFSSTSAISRKSSKTIRDQDLSWPDVMDAFPAWLNHISTAKYDPAHCKAFLTLYGHLVTHPIRLDPDGNEIRVRYIASTRIEYYTAINNDDAEIFDFSLIDEEHLAQLRSDLHAEQTKNMQSELASLKTKVSNHEPSTLLLMVPFLLPPHLSSHAIVFTIRLLFVPPRTRPSSGL